MCEVYFVDLKSCPEIYLGKETWFEKCRFAAFWVGVAFSAIVTAYYGSQLGVATAQWVMK